MQEPKTSISFLCTVMVKFENNGVVFLASKFHANLQSNSQKFGSKLSIVLDIGTYLFKCIYRSCPCKCFKHLNDVAKAGWSLLLESWIFFQWTECSVQCQTAKPCTQMKRTHFQRVQHRFGCIFSKKNVWCLQIQQTGQSKSMAWCFSRCNHFHLSPCQPSWF